MVKHYIQDRFGLVPGTPVVWRAKNHLKSLGFAPGIWNLTETHLSSASSRSFPATMKRLTAPWPYDTRSFLGTRWHCALAH